MKKILIALMMIVPLVAFGQRSVSRMVMMGDTTTRITDDGWIRVHTLDGTPSTEAYRIGNHFGTVFNVKDYGAVGDSVTDDTQAFLGAIAAVPATGAKIFVPVGRYRITQKLSWSKPIEWQGINVKRFTTESGNYAYEAGSVLISDGDGMTLMENITPTVGSVDWRASSFSHLHFMEANGDNNDTLLMIYEFNHTGVYNCSFWGAARGIIVDAGVDDASWLRLYDNDFVICDTGIYLDIYGPVNTPTVWITGGSFNVNGDQTGIAATGGLFSVLSNFKIDLSGAGAVGIDWGNNNTTISGVSIETGNSEGDTDITTIGILSNNADGLSILGGSIQSNGQYSTGISIASGSLANSIVGTRITNGDIGIDVNSGAYGTRITNVTFGGTVDSCDIQLDNGSYGTVLTGVSSQRTYANSVVNAAGVSTGVYGFTYLNGSGSKTFSVIPSYPGDITDGAPTQTQLSSAIGITPANAGLGGKFLVRDYSGNEGFYEVISNGTYWTWHYLPIVYP